MKLNFPQSLGRHLAIQAAAALLGLGLASARAADAKTTVPAAVGPAPAPKVVTVAPTPAPAPAALSFDSFRIITERNIFNPNRIGRMRETDSTPPPRMDQITLVGSMDSQKGLYAFFDSQDTNYRKALHEGGAIAQFTVKHISSDSVDLSRDGKTVSLRIGQQLRRPVGGDWIVTTPEPPSATATMDSTSAASAAANVIPADADPALRKLMEQRQKQLKQ